VLLARDVAFICALSTRYAHAAVEHVRQGLGEKTLGDQLMAKIRAFLHGYWLHEVQEILDQGSLVNIAQGFHRADKLAVGLASTDIW
jgi:hypothetical protein